DAVLALVVTSTPAFRQAVEQSRAVVGMDGLHERLEPYQDESPEPLGPTASRAEPDLVLDEVPFPEPEAGRRRRQAHPFLALPERLLDVPSLLAQDGDEIQRRRPQ